MKSLKLSLSFVLAFFIINCATAQNDLLLEQNPPSVKWKQINTPAFKIIFPRGFDEEAQRVANTMEHLYYPVSKTMGVKPSRLPLILQNQNALSNAFVTVAPRRSEFYTMPPQDYNFAGSNDWLNLLAVHEFRHVVQYQRSQTGWFTNIARFVFGHYAWSSITHIGVPNWFWEGDAVATETALTQSGRGRIPNFDLAFRTNLLENGGYDYHKQYLGSFKDFVPDYYKVGYHMVTHVRRKHEHDIWPKIFTRTLQNPYIPFNFSRSIKVETGNSLIRTYKNMLGELDSIWRWQIDQLEPTESSKAVYRNNKTFTNFEYPQFLSNGKIIALRNGLGNISQFVLIDSVSKAKKIHTPGMMNDAGMLSVGADKIVWSEFRYDPRYAVRSYSVIKVFDIKRKKSKKITSRSRLSGAAISPDGNKIVAIESNLEGKNSVVVLDSRSGRELHKFSEPDNSFFAMPRWSGNGKQIIVLKTTQSKKTITIFSEDGKESKDLFPMTSENLGHPVIYDHYVLYNSPYSGIDNIYAFDLETGKKYQVTSKLYGAYNPAISHDGRTIAFNNFTKYGMDVETMPFDPESWKSIEDVEDRNVRYYEPLIEQEKNESILTAVPQTEYEVKKYNPFLKSLKPQGFILKSNFHGENSIAIVAQNLLSTINATLGITPSSGAGEGAYYFGNVSYQKFYPIIDLEAGARSRSLDFNKDEYQQDDSVMTWQESRLSVGLRIPLNLTTNKYYRNLSISAHSTLTETSNIKKPNFEGEIGTPASILSADYRVSFYSLLKQAPRDVTSRFGFSGLVLFRNTPLKMDLSSEMFAAQLRIKLPGVLKHDGLQLRGGYATRKSNSNYYFSLPIMFPRGFSSTPFGNDYYIGAVDYKFPVWNSDLNLGSIINFQRFKGKLFYDRALTKIGTLERTFDSYGVELHADLNILRWYPLIEIGVRFSHVPVQNRYAFEMLIFQFDL